MKDREGICSQMEEGCPFGCGGELRVIDRYYVVGGGRGVGPRRVCGFGGGSRGWGKRGGVVPA